MRIVNNVLLEVAGSDIKNGTFIIPSDVTSIGIRAFWGCDLLQTIDIPKSVTNIDSSAFKDCQSLKSITLSKGITSIGDGAFAGCESLESITLPDSVTSIGSNIFGHCKSLESITLPEGLISIGDSAFYGCESLESITLPEGITSIGANAFSGCVSLESIILPERITSIGEETFSGCVSLESITLPEGITSIAPGTFGNCLSLELITLPDSITSIGKKVFCNCSSLKSITLPEGLISIGDSAFYGCESLESIILPERITSIGEFAFGDCKSLKSIILPDSVTSIGKYAFYDCYLLKSITIPKSVTSIGEFAFDGCKSLESITIAEGVTSIGEYAFKECQSLESITIPKSVTSIGPNVFVCCSSLKSITLLENVTSIDEKAFFRCAYLNELITPYGDIEINSHNITQSYLYLYANSILKDKYSNFDEFVSNDYIENLMNSDSIHTEDAIIKFKSLFYKLRKNFDIPNVLFESLSLEETEMFDYEVWNEIKNLVNIDDIEIGEAVSEMIAIFGLFESDNGARGRLHDYMDFIHNKNVVFTDNIMPDDTEAVKYTYYKLKSDVIIPEEFNIDLTQDLTENEMKNIKRLTGNYGKRINDFVKENYEMINNTGYKIINNVECFDYNIECFDYEGNFVNYSTLHRMFDGCDKKFDIDFYDFLIKYMDTILKNEVYQRRIKDIQKNFQSMKTYYKLHAGTDDVTLKQAINYVENIGFNNIHEGNLEFAKEVKKAGVASQEAFEYYQKIFELNDKRKLSSLIKRSNIYEINGYKIKTELLRRDDSFSMLVGETNYTNCCQVFGGIGHNCLAHAVNSDDGGIFVTKLITDDSEILLTESWDWQNNNVYCHDNIEATPYFKNNKNLNDVVAKTIELDALEIIRKSKEEVEKYIIERRNKIEKSLLSKREKDRELEELDRLEKREVIRLVTVGNGNSDLKLSDHYFNTINVEGNNIFNNQTFTLSHFQPVNYNSTQVYFNSQKSAYSDANSTQYIIAGSVEELSLGKLEPLVPIYRDERRIVEECKGSIRDYTLHKIKQMEEKIYPEDMQLYTDSDSLEDSHIILGEDWYLVYEEKDNNSIYISDLARMNPELEDEKGIQNKEIMNSLNNLLETYDTIEADLKEDTSYLLYLMNKRLGLLEQIGGDARYSFGDRSNSTTVSEADQATILKNIKQIRQDKNPELIMHHVVFKKKDKALDNRYTKKTR